MVTVWLAVVERLSNVRRYGIESPSRYTDLLGPRFPFSQPPVEQPSVFGDGAESLAHWSRFADGFAAATFAMNVGVPKRPTMIASCTRATIALGSARGRRPLRRPRWVRVSPRISFRTPYIS